MRSYSMWHFVSGFAHLTERFRGLPTLRRVSTAFLSNGRVILILVNLNLHGRMWLVATILEPLE